MPECRLTIGPCDQPAAYKYVMIGGDITYRCMDHRWSDSDEVVAGKLPELLGVAAVEKLDVILEDPEVGF